MAFLLDRMLIGTIRFALDKVVAAAAAEMDNEDGLRERLLEAQMRLELGEITDEEFMQVEADVVAGLRAIKERREAESGGAAGSAVIPDGMSVVGASAELSGDMHDDTEGGSPFVDIEAPVEIEAPAMREEPVREPSVRAGSSVRAEPSVRAERGAAGAESKRRKPKARAKPARSGAIRAKKR